MSNRLQWEKFWYRDFSDDLKGISAGARGLWISILCEMWGNGRVGELIGDIKFFSRIAGCQNDENIEDYLYELHNADIFDLIDPDTDLIENDLKKRLNDGLMKIRNRRLYREQKERKSHKLSQQKYEQKRRDDRKMMQNVSLNDRIEDRRKKIEDRRIEKDLKEVLLEHEKIYSEAYPALNLETETAKAQAWIESNPKNKKSNLKRFLNNWLSKAQDNLNKFPPREEKFL